MVSDTNSIQSSTAKACDDTPDKRYKPSDEILELYLMPKRYLMVVDEPLANESCPVPPEYCDENGVGHKLGRVKMHPFKHPGEHPPLGFIVVPSAKPIEVIKEMYPEIYEILKSQKMIMFPYNGP